MHGDLLKAVSHALTLVKGSYALAILSELDPGKIIVARNGSPLIIGIGEKEYFIASDIPALLKYTAKIIKLDNDEMAEISRQQIKVFNNKGKLINKKTELISWDPESAEKGGYAHFMLKEIHEQPTALADTLAERIGQDGEVVLDGLGLTPESIRAIKQIVIVACGTSYHAGLVGKYVLERWARVPVEVEVASEFRYREPVIGPDCLCIAISQSGETADTLAAMRLARQAGAQVLALTNIVGSQATREADGVLFTRAGLEIGVAATKTFLTQVLAVLLLALHFAENRGHLTREQVRSYTEELRHIPRLLGDYLGAGAAERVDQVARDYASSRFFMCLGRNLGLPVALEGALKLKEISYIPTDAYAAGEMKHGPIALLEEGSPVLVVATDGFVYEKLISNVQEVKARGARVIAVASEGNEGLKEMVDEVFYVPRTDEMLAPLLAVVPLQLFAYYVAKNNGEKVDQPRNLAKTVTVE